jgi:O-antigen/teichoic acid export membrane protein
LTIIKKNISANLFGNTWQVVMGLLFIPFYIKFLGVEAYGLIGIFAALQVLSGILDVGLSGTMNREMARRSVLPGNQQEVRNLVRSMEVIYWCMAIFIGILIIALSPFIAHHWVKIGQLSPHTIEQTILIMGLVLTLQCPSSFYTGGLMGLQRQILLNVINASVTTLRGAGAVLILWLISPTIQAFFLWQIFISALHTFLLALSLWLSLPPGHNRPIFEKRLLQGVSRFAAGMGAITIMSIILTQLDKIILSKMLSLEMFGYYTLAGIIAMSPLRFSWPLFSAIYPRFTQLASLNDQQQLKELYHKGCQFMAVLILPFAIVVAFFSYEIILLWTQSQITAEKTHLLVSILICGTALNALMLLPRAIQLAFGWTKLLFFKNLLAVIVLIPLIIYMTTHYGAIGATTVWLVLNIGAVLFEIPIMHRRLLPEEKRQWYWQDVLIPLGTAFLIACLGKLLMGDTMTQFMTLIYLIIISALTLGITLITTPATRLWVFERLWRNKIYGR